MENPWIFDSDFWGYPHIANAGIADVFEGNFSIWTYENGIFFDYPFIKKAGIAQPYQFGFSKLFLGEKNIKNLFYYGNAVKRVYYHGELVFEKG